MGDKLNWTRFAKDLKDEHRRSQKCLDRRAKQQTAENAADFADDPSKLEFNPDRLKAVVVRCLQLPALQDIIDDLSGPLPREELLERYGRRENDVRYCLMVFILITTGKRSDAIANLKVNELLKAKKSKTGYYVAKSRTHKTFKTAGASSVTFYRESAFLASCGYAELYRLVL